MKLIFLMICFNRNVKEVLKVSDGRGWVMTLVLIQVKKLNWLSVLFSSLGGYKAFEIYFERSNICYEMCK
jgi:hypothetical protein